MIPFSMLLTLLVAHFVGDFILQSDWMALNKSKDVNALITHVWVYTLTMAVALALFPPMGRPEQLFVFLMVNWLAHFVQDAVTSRLTSRLWFFELFDSGDYYDANGIVEGKFKSTFVVKEPNTRHWFFVLIGLDQLLHYLTLFLTYTWLLGA